MAFDSTAIALIGNAGLSDAPRLWGYRTNDTSAVVLGTGYFNSYAAKLVAGDLIYAHVDADGTDAYKLYVVTANDGTTVTVALSVTII